MSFAWKLLDRCFIKQPRLRRFVTWLLAGSRESRVELLGAVLHIHSIKEHGYLRAARATRRYSVFRDEAAVLMNLAMLMEAGDTFVDIGANVGLYSCALARRSRVLGGTGRGYAFEANPDTVRRLRLSAEPLGVEVHHCAISDRAGELEFVSGAVSHVFTTVENQSAYHIAANRTVVPCRRLDSFDIAGNRLVVKIDVEGQERQVLDGAEGLFAAGRVKAVYLDGYKDVGIPALLTETGFVLFEGRSLAPVASMDRPFSLLAVARQCVGR